MFHNNQWITEFIACPKCDKSVHVTHLHCTWCGAKLEIETPEPLDPHKNEQIARHAFHKPLFHILSKEMNEEFCRMCGERV